MNYALILEVTYCINLIVNLVAAPYHFLKLASNPCSRRHTILSQFVQKFSTLTLKYSYILQKFTTSIPNPSIRPDDQRLLRLNVPRSAHLAI